MIYVRPLIRMVASATVLTLFSLGVSSMAQAATVPTPTIVTSPSPTAVAPNPTADAFTAQVLALINKQRAAAGSPAVKWNQQVGNVSQDWAAHLGVATQSPTFDFATIHRTDAGGNEIPTGATWYREIIGFNFTPQSIVDWWMNSPLHKAAMLDPKATDIGIGYVVPTAGPYTGWHMVVSNLAAYSTVATSPTAPGSSVPAGTQYKTTIQLNLRSGPGTTYDILGYGVTGTIVTATGKTNDIWLEVTMGSQTGWMSSDYLTKYADATAITAPAPNIPAVVRTPIAIKAASLNGSLGAATGGEVYGLKDNGAYQCYQLGCIIYSPATGAHISMGGIRSLWGSTGYETGHLGYPLTDEIGGLKNGGVVQNYQGGSIVWSPNTGAHISVGGIRSVWASNGYENGSLGYPTSNEVSGLRNGGVYQNYQGGAIIWTPSTGGFISMGGIRSIWGSTGYENGRLGYPTSNEYVTSPGHVSQNYQGGIIHWSSSGSSITYK